MRHIISVFLVAIFLISSSCKKEDTIAKIEIPNELIGKWIASYERDWPQQDEIFLWDFSKIDEFNGSYEFYWQKEYPVENNMIYPGAQKGVFKMALNKVILDVENVGTQLDIETAEVLDTILWYTENDSEFELFGLVKSFEYELTDSTLIMLTDDNNDGDFDDDFEQITFVRN